MFRVGITIHSLSSPASPTRALIAAFRSYSSHRAFRGIQQQLAYWPLNPFRHEKLGQPSCQVDCACQTHEFIAAMVVNADRPESPGKRLRGLINDCRKFPTRIVRRSLLESTLQRWRRVGEG